MSFMPGLNTILLVYMTSLRTWRILCDTVDCCYPVAWNSSDPRHADHVMTPSCMQTEYLNEVRNIIDQACSVPSVHVRHVLYSTYVMVNEARPHFSDDLLAG